MAKKISEREHEKINTYAMALQNARTQPEIAAAIVKGGYDEPTLTEGDGLLSDLKTAFDANKQEDDETLVARTEFWDAFDTQEATLKDFRETARVIFRKDPVALERLQLHGRLSKTYKNWRNVAEPFAETMVGNTDYQGEMANFYPETTWGVFKAGLATLSQKNVDYQREIAESQSSTKAKDAAFEVMDEWMDDFYEVAELTLKYKPQLLEALGLFVRS